MWAVWTERQKWAGCRALSAEVEEQCRHTKNCLRACKELAQVRWTTRQLCGSHGTWPGLQRDELSRIAHSLTAEEYSSLTSWLNRNNTQSSTSSASPQLAPDAAPSQTAYACTALQSDMSTAYYGVLPPCISGRQIALLEGDQLEIECPREQQISEISDAQLVQHKLVPLPSSLLFYY